MTSKRTGNRKSVTFLFAAMTATTNTKAKYRDLSTASCDETAATPVEMTIFGGVKNEQKAKAKYKKADPCGMTTKEQAMTR
ncbi:hypothetical protein [Tunturiibacter gelidoferens]|uniref:Uncharacterized protein n=1 Tax=Tunturiibacter lichenicola TaxID=2051959 RepID=A0A7Y9NQN6_9BACT|nr:hypothetical protein [Edaphobacter lichenicola]NYF53135.1 hypothetical protein [Edaphobacter lichenicola]